MVLKKEYVYDEIKRKEANGWEDKVDSVCFKISNKSATPYFYYLEDHHPVYQNNLSEQGRCLIGELQNIHLRLAWGMLRKIIDRDVNKPEKYWKSSWKEKMNFMAHIR